MAPFIFSASPKKYASKRAATTPSIAPQNAARALRVSPPTRNIIAAVNIAVAENATSVAFTPHRASGTTKRHMTTHANAKLASAFAPTMPPKATSKRAKAPKPAAIQPIRQWSRATSMAPGSALSGSATIIMSPASKNLSSSICARTRLVAKNRSPLRSPWSISTSRTCEPYFTSPCISRLESSTDNTLARTELALCLAWPSGIGAKTAATTAKTVTSGSAETRSFARRRLIAKSS